MDWLTFISGLVASLAWPLSVVIIILILRRPLVALIPLLQRLKYKDLELDFGRRIDELQEGLSRGIPGPAPGAEFEPAPSHVRDIAKVSPRAAVIESWREVEQALFEVAARTGAASPAQGGSPVRVIESLQRAELLDPSTASAIHELRSLRNEAVHAPEMAVTEAEAIAYGSVAHGLAHRILAQGSTGQ